MLLKIFILFVFILVAFGAILFYKDVILFVYRMFVGRYSYKYFEYYKSLKKHYPKTICIKDPFIHYFNDFFVQNNVKTFETEVIINSGNFEFGQKFRDIIKKKGRPNYLSAHSYNDYYGKVVGYKTRMADYPSRALHYFFNGTMVMGQYSMKKVSPEDKQKLVNQLIEKYQIDKPEKLNFIIKDSEENQLQFWDSGFSLYIKYYTPISPEIHEKIKACLYSYKKIDDKTLKNSTYQEVSVENL